MAHTTHTQDATMSESHVLHIPSSLHQDIQRLPKGLVVDVLQDLVREFKRKEADDIIAEADVELAAEGEDTRPVQERRADFIALRNQIIAKYF